MCRILPFLFLIRRLRSSSSFPKDVNLTFIKCPKSKPINPFEIGKKRELQKENSKGNGKGITSTTKKFDVSQALLFKSDGVEQIFFLLSLSSSSVSLTTKSMGNLFFHARIREASILTNRLEFFSSKSLFSKLPFHHQLFPLSRQFCWGLSVVNVS